MNAISPRYLPLSLILASHILWTNAWAAETIQFNRDIRPILSAACFRCHGQDSGHREADLRLDIAESAFAPREEGNAIVAGDPEKSMVWSRIHSSDPDRVMPPPNAARQLTPEEKELIGAWIRDGAKYEKHWAFEPIHRVNTSEPQGSDHVVIDRWIAKGINDRGLQTNASADPRTLVRRLAFTLTGLPPTLEEVEQFATQPTEDNYERMVDHYLESPHYGEEMARHWLDVARYGDTHGLHLDNDRLIWPYRDWVVDAFNKNMPFSQFTIEQLAGDLLPNPTQSNLIATGFNRCNVTTAEGGAIAEEFLFRYAVDRTSTTIQTWLGLTGGCAVCHDHKYDPLTAREFYSMYSFFYSAADPAMDGNINTTEPFLKLPTPPQQQQLEQAKLKEEKALERLRQLANEWALLDETHSGTDTAEKANSQALSTSTPITDIWLDDELPLGATQRNTSRNGAQWTDGATPVPMGRRALATAFGDKFEQVISNPLVPKSIPDRAKIHAWVQTDADEPPQAIFLEVRSDKGSKRWVWTNDAAKSKLVDAAPERVVGPLPKPGVWHQITVPQSVATQTNASPDSTKESTVDMLPAGAIVQEIKLGVFGGICHWDGLMVTGEIHCDGPPLTRDFQAWWKHRKGKGAPHAVGEVAKAIQEGPESETGTKASSAVRAYFVAMVDSEVPATIDRARTQWQEARIEREILEDSIPGTMIFKDRDQPRQAHIMTRGQYDVKGDAVSSNTPSFLPPFSPSDSARPTRLDLANWLLMDSNPLVARVAVNRLWQQVYGLGIVKTSDDFGIQGTPPSHPELLDELADRFRRNGWDVKALMKGLVMSSAFRRDSHVSPDGFSKDPDNRWLARGPRIRLDAEQIRDNVLAVSGLLVRPPGGPGFCGYQPPKIWEPVGYGDSNTRYYIQQHGDALYRRSLYAYIKRTAPPPFMTNFDAPNRETFCTRRERSNTPLQALQLMNDVQHFEAARCLAERIVREGSNDDLTRVDRLFEITLARKPDEIERIAMLKFLIQSRERLKNAPEDAIKIANTGERWRDAKLPIDEVAPWTLVCNLVLNLDETVTRN
ncbi:MAG: DUF1553 domain-containing protein [Planctomycetes bacterium]|nr:DUF1553 domain-containing protein [Planctomycetota bacterium]